VPKDFSGFGVRCGLRTFRFLASGFRFSWKIIAVLHFYFMWFVFGFCRMFWRFCGFGWFLRFLIYPSVSLHWTWNPPGYSWERFWCRRWCTEMAGMASYLSHRKQRLLIKSCISDPFNLGSGVLQGSCLGPLLFSIYVAGLFKIIDGHLPNAFGHTHRRHRMLRWGISRTVLLMSLLGCSLTVVW